MSILKPDLDWIKEHIKKGNYNVYSVIQHVSKSGRTRYISFYIAPEKGLILCIDYYISQLNIGNYSKKHECISTTGFPYDVIHNLAIALYCPGRYNHDDAYKLKLRRL